MQNINCNKDNPLFLKTNIFNLFLFNRVPCRGIRAHLSHPHLPQVSSLLQDALSPPGAPSFAFPRPKPPVSHLQALLHQQEQAACSQAQRGRRKDPPVPLVRVFRRGEELNPAPSNQRARRRWRKRLQLHLSDLWGKLSPEQRIEGSHEVT